MKILEKIIALSFAVLAIVSCFVIIQNHEDQPVVGSVGIDKTSYDIIGTATEPVEVNTTYASSTKTIFARYMDNLHLDVAFTPNANDTYLNIFVEVSNDDGETFYPLTTKEIGSTEILNYVEGPGGSVGIPLVFPGAKNSTSTVEYKGALDYNIIADYVKISAAASTGTSTAHIRATVSTRQ
jgi:hypothetical protein